MEPLKGPAVASYGVFYQLRGETKNVSGGNSNNTERTLTGLTLGNYSIFVVGYGAKGEPVLPSDPSNITTITIGMFIIILHHPLLIIYPIYYHNVDIPLLPSNITIDSNASSIILSWLPTQFTPDSYKISYSCQFLCGSVVKHSTVSANGASSSHIIPADPGSHCAVNVTAVFGSNTSNTVTARTNTMFAGIL